MLSYIELSFQAISYDHNLFTRVYTLITADFLSDYWKKVSKYIGYNGIGYIGIEYNGIGFFGVGYNGIG